VWVQVEHEQVEVQVQLFVVEVVAHFEIVRAAGYPGFPISNLGDSFILDYICLLTNHGFVVDVGAYCC